ncbi:MAG: hypothetical protein CMJ49_11565 [Planctomycetaceae bacterium]|nr:hypothetical protein [Planctomycetaceae bacterium]
MSNAPLITIVLPTYNRARFLPQAIDSLMAQTQRDWELILVDDHSDDARVLDIIDDYTQRDDRIRAIIHDRNRRLPAALNTGLDAALGTLLTWTTDDNAHEPDALAVMADRLQQDPDLDMVYAQYVDIDDDDHILRPGPISSPDRLIEVGNCIGPCFMYRRSMRDRIGPYADETFMAEDYDYWLRAWPHCRIELIHQPLYRYRVHDASLSVSSRPAQARASIRAIQRFLETPPTLTRRQWAQTHCTIAKYAAEASDQPLVRRHVAMALRYDPLYVFRRRPRLCVRACLGARIANAIPVLRTPSPQSIRSPTE